MADLFNTIKTFTTKSGTIDKTWSPFIINRFFSMSNTLNLRDTAFKMNKYIFTLDKDHRDLLKTVYDININRQRAPWIKYLKKPSEKSENFKEIIDEFQTYFKWTVQERDTNALLLINQLKDKDTLFKVLNFIGASKVLYKKYGLLGRINKEEKVEPKKQGVSLFNWSK